MMRTVLFPAAFLAMVVTVSAVDTDLETITEEAPAPLLALPRAVAPMAYQLYNDSGIQATAATCADALQPAAGKPAAFLWGAVVAALGLLETCDVGSTSEQYGALRQALLGALSDATSAALLAGSGTSGGGGGATPPSLPVACYELPLAVDPAVGRIWGAVYGGGPFCTGSLLGGGGELEGGGVEEEGAQLVALPPPAPIGEASSYDPDARWVDYVVPASANVGGGRRLLGGPAVASAASLR